MPVQFGSKRINQTAEVDPEGAIIIRNHLRTGGNSNGISKHARAVKSFDHAAKVSELDGILLLRFDILPQIALTDVGGRPQCPKYGVRDR
ncbi:MAG TPA: hypothetical protein VFS77_19690 [Pyrinomonadaceae bacterium]|nr:hypothetical protein [Pyrinomonadaceae bacterium]